MSARAFRTQEAAALLLRSRRELAAAEGASEPAARFRHAHLAALRAAAAVLVVREVPAARRRPRPVWELLARAAPELAAWATFFAAGADLRAALESGRRVDVPAEIADDLMGMARMFLEEVEGEPLAEAS
jgi:hypothetical protein